MDENKKKQLINLVLTTLSEREPSLDEIIYEIKVCVLDLEKLKCEREDKALKELIDKFNTMGMLA